MQGHLGLPDLQSDLHRAVRKDLLSPIALAVLVQLRDVLDAPHLRDPQRAREREEGR